jgi:hypothetical protein
LQRLLSLEQLKYSGSFYPQRSQKYKISHLWDRDNPHGTAESNYQHSFSVNVWCGVIGPYIFPKRLTGDIYANFLQAELPALLENVPLQTR